MQHFGQQHSEQSSQLWQSMSSLRSELCGDYPRFDEPVYALCDGDGIY